MYSASTLKFKGTLQDKNIQNLLSYSVTIKMKAIDKHSSVKLLFMQVFNQLLTLGEIFGKSILNFAFVGFEGQVCIVSAHCTDNEVLFKAQCFLCS